MVSIYIVVFAISFSLTLLVRKVAIRKSIMDIPNDRSSHTIPTPRGGGLALAVAWFAGLMSLYLLGRIPSQLFFALLSGIPLTLIGFADDVFNLKPAVRFLVQFFCAALALFFLGGLSYVDCGPWTLGSGLWTFFLTLLAFIAIVWSINLFNFLDGIDGYIATEVIFIAVAAYVLTGDSLGLVLAASVFGFLLWNWQKAKIFMGDVGSTLLGFTIAVWAIFQQNTHTSSLIVWIILTSVFWFDATVTLYRRFRNKEKLSQAHRKHAYQRIVQAGWSHQKTVLYSLGINLIGFGFAWLARRIPEYDYIFLMMDVVVLYFVMRFVDGRKEFERSRG